MQLSKTAIGNIRIAMVRPGNKTGRITRRKKIV
jgi:hypothetical protein